MTLKVYADRMSQPSRAVIIFCKVNGIQFEEVVVNLGKREHLRPEYKEINPLKKVPAVVDGRFKLAERYPSDLFKRAKIHSVLDWHHSNLRHGAATFVRDTVLAPALGLPLNPTSAAEAEKVLTSSLLKLETVWLKGKGKFLLGSFQPSIADISLVCEIMQLELVDEKDINRILGPHKRVLQWIEDTKKATSPHFEEVHAILFKAKARFHKQTSAANSKLGSSIKPGLSSKL